MRDLYGEKDKRYKAFFKDTYYVNKANDATGTKYTWSQADATRYRLDASRVGNPAFDITLGDTAVYISRKPMTQAERDAKRYATFTVHMTYAARAPPEPQEG